MNKHDKNVRLIVFIFSTILSLVAWYFSQKAGLTTLYNDAMAHLNLSRMVFDNLHPGVTQLGGVWLPLNQILYLPLIWNDWAWHTGFAGSIISMICYIASVMFIFESVLYVSKSRMAGIIGALVFAINVNILYLQSTPLTESLFVGLFTASLYFFIRWIIGEKSSDLVIVALLGFPLVLTRYDGWFVMMMELVMVIIYEIIIHKRNRQHILGVAIVYATPFIYGIALWLIWNKLIFGSFLYFALGPYSAHAQQTTIASSSSGLITKGNLWYSFFSYYNTVKDNVGPIILFLTGVCASIFFIRKDSLSLFKKIIIVSFLISPAVFNILSLYLGFSIVNVPESHWNPVFDQAGKWFNVRYGIFMLPISAILIGFVSNRSKILSGLIVLAVLVQTYSFLLVDKNVVTITDGTMGSSKFQNEDIADYLRNHVKKTDQILLSISFFSPVAFRSGVEMKQIIHEGTGEYWSDALNYPYKSPNWIVLSNGNVGDSVYNTLINKQYNSFLSLYRIVYRGVHANIYKRRSDNEIYIGKDKTDLTDGTHKFKITGVNSYDLAYGNEEKIRENFSYFKQMHINTIRLWAFGDGIPNGFQPKAGIFNEDRLKMMDLVLKLAKDNSIRVIPVLANNWTDFGGKTQYVDWIGKQNSDLFFTDQDAINLYKNYVNNIISRRNTLTGTEYRNDPTILAWELMNEPRIGSSNRSDSVDLRSWAANTAEYIKSIDSNHLVSIGTETAQLCTVSKIDLCSVHLYVENQGVPKYATLADADSFIRQQKLDADSLNKPIYIGEIGIRKRYQLYDQNPLNILTKLSSDIKENNYAGLLIWDWSLKNDISFGFSPDGEEGKYSIDNLKSVLSGNTNNFAEAKKCVSQAHC
jgi:hypothetical protein